MAKVVLRAARPEEADQLGEPALRSKAYWGYSQEFLDACAADLRLKPEELAARRATVAVAEREPLGFYTIDGEPPHGELGNLWIDPSHIGRGLGRMLWEHALDTARGLAFRTLDLEADPHAEGFYLAVGARNIGERPSDSIPGRMLPALRIEL